MPREVRRYAAPGRCPQRDSRPATTACRAVPGAGPDRLPGLFVAAPLTACAVVFVKMLYVEDTLGDKTVEVEGETQAERLATTELGWQAG